MKQVVISLLLSVWVVSAVALEQGEVIATLDNVQYVYVGPAQKSEIDMVTTMQTGQITVVQKHIEHAALAVLQLNGDYGEYRMGNAGEKLSLRVRNTIEHDGTQYTVAYVTTTANGTMTPQPVTLDTIGKIVFDEGTGYDQREGTSVAWMRMRGSDDDLSWIVDTLCLPDDMVSFDGRAWHTTAQDAGSSGLHGIRHLKLGRFFQGDLRDIIHDGMRLQEIDIPASPWCGVSKETDGSIFNGPETLIFLSRSGEREHFDFSQDIKVIDTMACANSANLKTVTFPRELRQINHRAFYNCGLRKVVLPQTSQVVQDGSYGYVKWTMQHVGREAFAYNKDLETIVIPDYLHLYKDAFIGCPNLKSIYLSGSNFYVYKENGAEGGWMSDVMEEQDGATLFDEQVYENCVLYVASEYYAQYLREGKGSYTPFFNFKHIEVATYNAQGDVNGDDTVSGADVTALYNMLLDGTTIGGIGDVNGDGVVNGADVTALYNLLLN